MTVPAFLKAWWPMIVTVGAGLVGYGSLASDVTHIKYQQDKTLTDHDVLIRVDTRQEQMSKDITDMKTDIKDIAKAVK